MIPAAMNSEKTKMLAGRPYDPADPELAAGRASAQAFLAEMNRRGGEYRTADLRPLLGAVGEGTVLRPAFACDYGYNISIGRAGFINFNCVFLDCAAITIGDHLQILIVDCGPGFDFRRYLVFDQDRFLHPHGRGILLARAAVEVEYFEPGNQVRVTLPLADLAATPDG